jgi:heme-degrading monooxygenase HmoA
MLKARPGFRSYCALLNEEGEGVSVTAFDGREQAIRANEQVFGWVEANLRDLLPDAPEVIAGECRLAEVAPGRGESHDQRQPPYVVVREFADLGPAEGTREAARRLALPLITGSPGFRSVCLFRDEREPARAAMVALFDTRAGALQAHERSMRALREAAAAAAAGGAACPPPRVGVGRAIVFATADQ